MPKMPLIRFVCKKEPSALENTHFLSDQLTAYRYAVNPPLIPLIGMEIGIIPTSFPGTQFSGNLSIFVSNWPETSH